MQLNQEINDFIDTYRGVSSLMQISMHSMSAWNLAENYINCFIAEGLIRLKYARRHILSCVMKASACQYTLHAIIGVKSNIIPVK